ncbi:18S rRNA maturation protein [Ascosphaera atra]|nr:18S rRNA maturation protein [Ascosphaera atra]
MPKAHGKRKLEDGEEVHEHKHKKPSKRRQTENNEKALPAPRAIKDKIRDLKRWLEKKEKLPADVRVDKERELQQYESELVEALERKKRSAMIAKYHFVRFLERKTASKALNRLKKQKDALEKAEEGSTDKTNTEDLDARIHIAEVDFNYTRFSPLTEKYVSLFPKSKKANKDDDDNNDEDETKAEDKQSQDEEKPPLWYAVEECMKEGEEKLWALRDGRLNIGHDGREKDEAAIKATLLAQNLPGSKKKKKDTKKEEEPAGEGTKEEPKEKVSKAPVRENRRARRERMREERNMREALKDMHVEEAQDDDDSEGGFFEEL